MIPYNQEETSDWLDHQITASNQDIRAKLAEHSEWEGHTPPAPRQSLANRIVQALVYEEEGRPLVPSSVCVNSGL